MLNEVLVISSQLRNNTSLLHARLRTLAVGTPQANRTTLVHDLSILDNSCLH